MKFIGIVGAGFVGAACAKAMLLRGSCDQILINDVLASKARGLVNDLSHAAVLCPPVRVEDGPLRAMAEAHVIVVTAGINERAGHAVDREDPRGRLLLLERNARTYEEIVPELARIARRALLLVVTDPPDPLADLARRWLGDDRVLSSGTFLDSLRFRLQIARQLGCHPLSVSADVLGEHGTSQVYAWSTARIGGVSVLELAERRGFDRAAFREDIERSVKFANIEIIEGTGASQHGIGVVTARLVEAILRDEGLVAPVGRFQPDYGATLSLPSVVGAGGVSAVVRPALEEAEELALVESARILRQALAAVLRDPGGASQPG